MRTLLNFATATSMALGLFSLISCQKELITPEDALPGQNHSLSMHQSTPETLDDVYHSDTWIDKEQGRPYFTFTAKIEEQSPFTFTVTGYEQGREKWSGTYQLADGNALDGLQLTGDQKGGVKISGTLKNVSNSESKMFIAALEKGGEMPWAQEVITNEPLEILKAGRDGKGNLILSAVEIKRNAQKEMLVAAIEEKGVIQFASSYAITNTMSIACDIQAGEKAEEIELFHKTDRGQLSAKVNTANGIVQVQRNTDAGTTLTSRAGSKVELKQQETFVKKIR